MTSRILLVDDHLLFREALHALLGKFPEMEVVGEAANGVEALAMVKELQPDIVFMDINMPKLNGIETTREILAVLPQVKVIALSTFADQMHVAEMMNAGASAYVTKADGFNELHQAIEAVIQQKKYLCPSVTTSLVSSIFISQQESRKKVTLSRREQQVICRIAEGKSSLQISKELDIAAGTVDVHRRNLMRKLELHSAVELTRYAIGIGMVSD